MRRVVIVALCSALAACGFHLRGTTPIDIAISPLSIESVNPGSALLPPLRRALVDAGAALARPGESSSAVLAIVGDEMGQRVSAVSAQGRPREVELSYTVTFELQGSGGLLLDRRSVTMTREFAVDERDVLGKAQEAEVLRDGLVRDMVAALVRHVATVRTP